MKTLPIKKEFQWTKIGSYKSCNPFSITFVYPYNESPFVLKGGAKNISKFLELYKIPAVVHRTFFCHGEFRTFITTVNINAWVYFDTVKKGKKRIWIESKERIGEVKEIWLRKIPRKWIQELEEFI